MAFRVFAASKSFLFPFGSVSPSSRALALILPVVSSAALHWMGLLFGVVLVDFPTERG